MKFIVFCFIVFTTNLFAQTYKFDSLELIRSNISRVLEFKEFYKVDSNDSLIFQRHWTGEMLLDSLGINSGFFNNEPSKFGVTSSDTVYIGNKPRVVLLSNGTVYWYYYSKRMVMHYDSISGNYVRKIAIGLPDSVIVQNSESVIATYKYEYTFGLSEVISKQRKAKGKWYFCHQFNNKFTPVEYGDTIILRRNFATENCSDLHLLTILPDGTIDYSSDTINLKGLPYPDNYKNWYLNERGIFFTKKNGFPVDAWKILFKDDETLLLIYDWDRPE